MKVSLVIPFIDQLDILQTCIKTAYANAGEHSEFQLVLIDNGSHDSLDEDEALADIIVRNDTNQGVVATFKQGYEASNGDIVLFIHSDVLIHESHWVSKLQKAFQHYPKVGLAGFLGARGIAENGGRMDTMSNMQGKVWGGCECHEVAARHHGTQIDSIRPATVLDGMAMAFRRETLQRLVDETDAFADWRAPHHFYDKILSVKTIRLGYQVAVLPFECDHYSGATANRSAIYHESMRTWLEEHGHPVGEHADQAVYNLAEKQMFDELLPQLPITVGEDFSYFSRAERIL